MSDLSAILSKEVISALISSYFQELTLLTPAQELELTHLLLNEDDEVEIEADVHEGTLQ